MVKVRDCVARCIGEDASVTWATKENCPDWAVEPEIIPFGPKLIPDGKVPEVRVHAYGVVPPLAPKAKPYALPVVPAGTLELAMVSEFAAGGFTVTVAAAEMMGAATLVAVIVAVVLELT
jgi:hypothetical protein